MPGVEEIAWLEIRSRLSKVRFGEYLFAKEQNGIVVFDYGGPVADLFQLRTIEDLFLMAHSMPKMSRSWRDLRQIVGWLEKSAGFGRAVSALLGHQRVKGNPTYRVVARKYGKHQYRRKDFQASIMKGVKSRYPRWKPVAENARVEIWANMLGSRLLIGLRLSDRSMRHRYRREVELKASLRPSVAAAMVYLTQPEPGDTFVDPLCGSGTLLLERRSAESYRRIFGGDIDPVRALTAWQNVATQRKDIEQKAIRVAQWDGCHLPFATGSLDKVATNLPFGKTISSGADIRQLYPHLFAEFERSLRPGGRAVVLSSEYDLVKNAVRRHSGLEISTGYSIAVLGHWGRIYIVERKR
jgi:23S rRNA G2445 N2-methylase RlmL